MLVEYKLSNYKSYKDETSFSLLSGGEKGLETSLLSFEKHKYLRTSVILGANAVGKTAFIDSMLFMRSMVLDSVFKMPGDSLEQRPNWAKDKSPTTFMVSFIRGPQRYLYSFSYTEERILSESLYYYPSLRKEKLFIRDLQRFSFNPNYRMQCLSIESMITPNRLALTMLAGFGKVEPIIQAYLFFKDQIMDSNIQVSEQKPETLNAFLSRCGYNQRQFSKGLDKLSRLYGSLEMARSKDAILLIDDVQAHIHPLSFFILLDEFHKSCYSNTAQVLMTSSGVDILDYGLRKDQIWFSSLRPNDNSSKLFCLREAKSQFTNLRKSYLEGCFGAIPLMKGN